MGAKTRKIFEKAMSGKADYNISFSSFYNMLLDMGFSEIGQKGSHIHLKNARGIKLTIQPTHDGKAKGYQVRQFRDLKNGGLI